MTLPKLLQDLDAVPDSKVICRNNKYNGSTTTIEFGIRINGTPHVMTLLFPSGILSVLLSKTEPWEHATTCMNLRPYTPSDLVELVTFVLGIPNDRIAGATYPDRRIREFLTNPDAWWPLRKEEQCTEISMDDTVLNECSGLQR